VGCQQLTLDSEDLTEKNASADAVFLDFTWNGELRTGACYNPDAAIDQQALYTVGQLNFHNSVGRLDGLKIEDVQKVEDEAGCKITYRASMVVAWGKRNDVPQTFDFLLPRDVSHTGTQHFADRYTSGCLDWHAHDVTPGIFWYYYRPEKRGCDLDENDIVRLPVEISPSSTQSKGKYPEYHKVWEDDSLEVVALFGMVKEDGGRWDGGVSGYNQFIEAVMNALSIGTYETEPAEIPGNPGSLEEPIDQVLIRGTLPDGRTVKVSVFLIESVTRAPNTVWEKYEELTPTADFIVYNGHSGLGQNIRRLASRGEWSTGQYVIVFMNGCDTFAYIDSALADAHAAVNPDDPEGTKYLDIVANAMPSLFKSMPYATMAIFNGLLSYDAPMTYEEILDDIDDYEVSLVTGEHDNEYFPGR
jgi:hypothetical protein